MKNLNSFEEKLAYCKISPERFHAEFYQLIALGYNQEQLTRIAITSSGRQIQKGIEIHFVEIINLGFNIEQIISIFTSCLEKRKRTEELDVQTEPNVSNSR